MLQLTGEEAGSRTEVLTQGPRFVNSGTRFKNKPVDSDLGPKVPLTSVKLRDKQQLLLSGLIKHNSSNSGPM